MMEQFNTLVKLLVITCLLLTKQLSQGQEHVLIHTVEEGQTLYSISKTYEVDAEVIKMLNPSIDDSNTIKPGQILRIKLENVDKLHSMNNIVKKEIIHTVKEKETLFGISKAYNVDLTEIKDWNKIEDNRIRIGQELIVGWRYETKKLETKKINDIPNEPVSEVKDDSTERIVEEKKVVKAPDELPIINNTSSKQDILKNRYTTENAGKDIMSQKGPAIWFNTDNRMMNSRYYGLFSDVPVGSMVRVKNLINNKVVYVKVIGSLPDTAENYGAMIKLTPAARSILNSSEDKVRVEVTYAK